MRFDYIWQAVRCAETARVLVVLNIEVDIYYPGYLKVDLEV